MSSNPNTAIPAKQSLWLGALGALGVVFGDIGTSPLYALRECFDPIHGIQLNPDNVLGVLSLIFWTIILVICVKYMAFVLRADNRGEGGVLALMALAGGRMPEGHIGRKWFIVPLGLFGAALLYGDGAITPAISVLSAVEGLKIATPLFSPYVIPITLLILLTLFFAQKAGTRKIGYFFGPIIVLWFATIAGLGVHEIVQNPAVLQAVNPLCALAFFADNGWVGFFVLGAVVLAVTGGEALYADMGHFGRRPIRVAWFAVALPSLVLNYFGQGALILRDVEAIHNPFYLMAPKGLVLPLVILATAATVIASQALISGVFSVTRQAVQLGYAPRIRIIHTSSREIGQIYVPFVNWVLLGTVIWLVLTFRSSSALAAAYGAAVTMVMVITTILASVVAYRRWRWPAYWVALFAICFVTIDLVFFVTCALKLLDGGWVSLAIGAIVFTLLVTWQGGRRVLGANLRQRSMPVEKFVEIIHRQKPVQVSGTAVYMTGDPWGVPVALLHNLKHNKVLHELNIILTIATRDEPIVDAKERVRIEKIADNIYRVFASYGFMEMPKIRDILNICLAEGIPIKWDDITYVLGRETIIPSKKPGMMLWQEKLFALMARNALKPTVFFDIPADKVIEVGIQVEI